MSKHANRGNSAFRRMQQDRQDSRRFAIAGVLFALLLLLPILFGGQSQDSVKVVGPDPTESQESNLLADYASGATSKAMLQELEQ